MTLYGINRHELMKYITDSTFENFNFVMHLHRAFWLYNYKQFGWIWSHFAIGESFYVHFYPMNVEVYNVAQTSNVSREFITIFTFYGSVCTAKQLILKMTASTYSDAHHWQKLPIPSQ